MVAVAGWALARKLQMAWRVGASAVHGDELVAPGLSFRSPRSASDPAATVVPDRGRVPRHGGLSRRSLDRPRAAHLSAVGYEKSVLVGRAFHPQRPRGEPSLASSRSR